MMRETYLQREKMHAELQPIFNEFNESRIAIDLLKKPTEFNSVGKISSAIIKIILANHEKIAEIIASDPKIINEMREPYFGCLYSKDQIVTPSGALARVLAALNDKKTSLDIIMQLHCIFCYRIYPKLVVKNEISELSKQLHANSLFSDNFKTEKKCESTFALGIVKHPIFTKLLGNHNKLHIRAIDKYKPNDDVCFFKRAREQSTPVVCGPSGHTRSLLLGAKSYGDLSTCELKEYTLACFAFLTAGGNHSFHEVMSVASLIGVDSPLPTHIANKI